MSTKRHHALVADTPVGGRYRVRKILGRWRIGTAYDATDGEGTRALTLLVVDLAQDRGEHYRRWIRRESERSRRLPDDLLTPLDGDLLDEETAYLVIGPFQGLSLLQVVRRDGPFSEARAARVGERLARLVARGHEAAVSLGGLRPTTVLLDGEEATRPRVFDMGLERGLEELLAAPPQSAHAYRAPDWAPGRRPTPADDIFALGALLYYQLTGEKPPRIDPDEARLATPPSWKRADSELCAYLDPVVLKAMAPRARDRYRDARQLADALGALGEVFRLSPAAREMLGLSGVERRSAFRRVPTDPFLLHDLLGLPPEPDEERTVEPEDSVDSVETLESVGGRPLDDD